MKVWTLAQAIAWCGLVLAYLLPTDALYALTIWPPFVWAVAGSLLALTVIRSRKRFAVAMMAAWLGFFLAFGDEKNWVMNRVSPVSDPDLVVITLNCAGGSSQAAEEAFALAPDILLLQESPSEPALRKLAQKHFGSDYQIAMGVDASIVVRTGQLTAIEQGLTHTLAIFQTESGDPILLGSLRLSPPVFRLDYWNPECWKDYAANRAIHRRELQEIATLAFEQTQTQSMIIGGDFNWTPERGLNGILAPMLRPASKGSGYTAINSFPLARIDQVWSSLDFAASSEAFTTKESDHRMVVAKLKLQPTD